jgi:predicted small metal-binding protein
MAKVINCECGLTLRGESDEEVIAAAEQHIQENHPELVGAVSREQLEGWVQEE